MYTLRRAISKRATGGVLSSTRMLYYLYLDRNDSFLLYRRLTMAKSNDKQKQSNKKKAQKSIKEKRADKKAKKDQKI